MNKIKIGSQVKLLDGLENSKNSLIGTVTSYRVLQASKKRLFHVKWGSMGGLNTNVLEDHLYLI